MWATIDQGTRFMVGVPFITLAGVVATTTDTLGQPQKLKRMMKRTMATTTTMDGW
jgi:hypothetical protein